MRLQRKEAIRGKNNSQNHIKSNEGLLCQQEELTWTFCVDGAWWDTGLKSDGIIFTRKWLNEQNSALKHGFPQNQAQI